VTVDAPVAGVRRRTTPARADSGLTLGNFEPVTLGNFGPDSGIDVTEYFGHVQRLTRRDWSWADLAAATATTGLPFIVKGILGAADARAAVDAGAAAVYVSNHGGRQLDAAPATLDALEEVVAAVGGDAEVLLDGGIRSGTDVVMALALGARAVLIGRPAVMGLAAAGQAGVARILENPRPRGAHDDDLAGPRRGARPGPLRDSTRPRFDPLTGARRPVKGPASGIASGIATAFDPFEPGQAQDAWPLLAELRHTGPVATISAGCAT